MNPKTITIFLWLMICGLPLVWSQSVTTIDDEWVLYQYASLEMSSNKGEQVVDLDQVSWSYNGQNDQLQPGDLLLIYQPQGAEIDTTESGKGGIVAKNGAGQFEMNLVHAVNPSTGEVTLNCPLQHGYSLEGKSFAMKVPQFESLEITSSGRVSALSWNGNWGGIIALDVNGEMIINGMIDGNGLGFRGGETEGVNSLSNDSLFTRDIQKGANKGEGVASFYQGWKGYGANANGGGGGSGPGSGGGGGAGLSDVGVWNGMGTIPLDDSWGTAWELEEAGMPSLSSNGGGRGGYSSSDIQRDPLVDGPQNAVWGGSEREVTGGLGGQGIEMVAPLQGVEVFFGGGGGAGAQVNDGAGNGGNGGGIIVLNIRGSISGSGMISANGDAGENSQAMSGLGDGAGGGGAGGTVAMYSNGGINGISVQVNGGNGGDNLQQSGNVNAEGPGGGGAGGACFSFEPFLNYSAVGGTQGQSTSESMVDFLPNGSTAGSSGAFQTIQYYYYEAGSSTEYCKGDSDSLEIRWVEGSVPRPGIEFYWYDDPLSNQPIKSGIQFGFEDIRNDSLVYFGTCPTTYKSLHEFRIDPLANIRLKDSIYACDEVSIRLSAEGGGSYYWYPETSFDSQGKTVNYLHDNQEKWVYLEVSSPQGCRDIDSVFVEQRDSLEIDYTTDTLFCFQQLWELGLDLDSIRWEFKGESDEELLDSFQYEVLDSGIMYFTLIDSVRCEARKQMNIRLKEHPQLLVADTALCRGDLLTLSKEQVFDATDSLIMLLDSTEFQSLEWAVVHDSLFTIEVTDTNEVCQYQFEIGVGEIRFLPDYMLTSNCEDYKLEIRYNGIIQNDGLKELIWSVGGNEVSRNTEFTFDPEQAGVFDLELQVESDYGCEEERTYQIQSGPLPVIPVDQFESAICLPYELELDTGFVAVDGWQYYLNGVELAGHSVEVNDSGAYVFEVYIEGENGCLDTVKTDTVLAYIAEKAEFTIRDNISDTLLPGKDYEVLFSEYPAMDWEFEDNIDYSSFPYVRATDEGEICIQLITSDVNSCLDTLDKCFYVVDFKGGIPDFFSPNEDGVNDYFGDPNRPVARLSVYNRWGAQVFDKQGENVSWDGRNANGKNLSEGVYFYQLKYVDDQFNLVTGNVVLLR